MATSYVHTGRPWQFQPFNERANGDFGFSWARIVDTLPSAAEWQYSAGFVTNNKIFICGGQDANSGDAVADILTCDIYNEGQYPDASTYAILEDAFDASYHHDLVVTGNRVYKIGGIGADHSTRHSVTRYAIIDEDGDIGSWSNGTTMPAGVAGGSCVVTQNRVYYIGGAANPDLASTLVVYTAPIENGVIGTWANANQNAPNDNASRMKAFATSTRLYLVNSNDELFYSEIDEEDGSLGTWTEQTVSYSGTAGAIGSDRARGGIVTTQNTVFIIGGSDTNIAHYAPIDEYGVVGETWYRSARSRPTGLSEIYDGVFIVTTTALLLFAPTYYGRNLYYTTGYTTGGYADYTGIGIDTFVNDGSFSQPLPEVAGARAIFAGYYNPPLVTMSGGGVGYIPPTLYGYGNCNEPKATITGTAASDFRQALYASPLADYGGVASNAYVAWGNFRTPRPFFRGVAYLGPWSVAADYHTEPPRVSGVGSTEIVGWGDCDTYRPVVAGIGNSVVTSTGVGNYVTSAPAVTGGGVTDAVGYGDCLTAAPTVTATGWTTNHGVGRYVTKVAQTSGYGMVYSVNYGAYMPRVAGISGVGLSTIPVIGAGRYHSYIPVFSAVAAEVLVGVGGFLTLAPVFTATAVHQSRCDGSFFQPAPRVNGLSHPTPGMVLQFSKPATAYPTALPPAASDILSYSRVI